MDGRFAFRSSAWGWGSHGCRLTFDFLGGAANAGDTRSTPPLVILSGTGPLKLDAIMAGVVLWDVLVVGHTGIKESSHCAGNGNVECAKD
jgi:hypothetical protein